MALNREHFEERVRRAEAFAKRAPGAYRRRVIGLAALGYGYLAFVIVVLLLLTAGMIALIQHSAAVGAKLALVMGALLVVVVRAVWVRFPAPEGERLARPQAPEFFALLDRLRKRLATPRIHDVLVTAELNAGVVQRPRLGLFGWHRNYLLLGLPLMKCLTAPQFEAVLAHELGHLSHGHARTGNWIYRLRLIWMRLEVAFEERGGGHVIRAFLNWYIPFFSAYSFPLARMNEFEADAAAARLTSAATAGQALTGVAVIGRYLSERYWPGIMAAARDEARPAFGPYGALQAHALQRTSAADLEQWLQSELAQPTTHADTHPSLRDRLAAVGVEAALVLPLDGQGADRLLGEQRARLEGEFDATWRSDIAELWEHHYQATRQKRERLAQLAAKAGAAPLDEAEALERAQLAGEVGGGPAEALELFRELVARAPDSLPYRFFLGRQLLLQDDEEGVALVEGVVEIEADAILAGSQLLRDFWWRRGNPAKARAWHDRASERADLLERAQAERSGIGLGDRWLPHGLDRDQVAAVVDQLQRVPHVRRAYLVRKHVANLPEQPLYVLAFRVARVWPFGKARAAATFEQIRTSVALPGQGFILNLSQSTYRYGIKLARCRGARIM